MEELSKTAPNKPFSMVLHADVVESQLESSEAHRVSMAVTTLPRGAATTASHAYIVLVQIASCPSTISVILPDRSRTELLRRSGDVCLLPPGTVADNRSQTTCDLIQYRLPRLSVVAFASRRNCRDIDSLAAPSFVSDFTMTALSRAILPLLRRGEQWKGPVARYFTLSLYSHLVDRYGVTNRRREGLIGGFSPQHKRLIKEALNSPSDRAVAIEELANLCGLSIGHFSRAFRQTYGSSFHKHLLEERIRRAKRLLLETKDSLKEIALQIGYADQTTFTESFTRAVGVAPGRYRRRFAEHS